MLPEGAYRIASDELQDPPRVSAVTRAMVSAGAVPLRSVFFRRPCEKNATVRLSGDQNGCSALSVLGRRRASGSPSERSQMND